MGRAKIVENKGGGLYRATPIYNLTALNDELAKIQTAEAEYSALLYKMLKTIDLLRKEHREATTAVDNVIEQWKQKLIDRAASVIAPPSPADPDDPATWPAVESAKETELLAAINSARTTASVGTVTRNSDLDLAMLRLLKEQSSTKKMGHFTSGGVPPETRAAVAGYFAESVGETLDYGAVTAADVVQNWQIDPVAKATLLGATYLDVGISFVYSRTHPAGYLWGAIYAVPGTPPPNVTVTYPDPAKTAAKEEETKLDKIELPKTDPLTPEKLSEVIGEFGKAAAKLNAAEKDLEELMAERLARLARNSELLTFKSAVENLVLDVWACYMNDELAVGDTVYTAEVPGHWLFSSSAPLRSATIYAGTSRQRTIFFNEQSWNIIRRDTSFSSSLTPATTMTPEIGFYNLAMEPSHLKWKPVWRYGIIESITGAMCSVNLNPATARHVPTERGIEGLDIDLNENDILSNVAFDYPPCNVTAFVVGDEVLIRFNNQDRTKPVVIGFRRAPKACQPVRVSWEQIQ